MATWQDVCDLAARLPDTEIGSAHEGSPLWSAGRHAFARLRWDGDRELLQWWTKDMDTEAQLADRRDVFPVVSTYRYRVSAWAFLDRLDPREAGELVLKSYAARCGERRMSRVDVAAVLPPPG